MNIPYVPFDELKGIMVCRQSLGNWIEKFERRVTPNNKDYFWLTGGFQNHEIEATDNDEWALKNNYVAVVPVKTDMTDHEQLRKMKKWDFSL